MRKIVKELTWFAYRHPTLGAIMLAISCICFSVGIVFGRPTSVNPEIAKIVSRIGLSFILPAILLIFIFSASTDEKKNPKIAKEKAKEILKENPQLSPPLNNHAELVKWLKSYRTLAWRKESLTNAIEQLKELPKKKEQLEAKIENLKTEIRNLKSELRIS